MKKSIFLFICIISVHLTIGQQNVGVGTATPDASAKLDVSSTTQGMLVPRMTTAQRMAISSPASGLLVFDMTTNSFWFKGGSTWVQLVDSVHTEVHRNGPTMIYAGMTDNVGVGVLAPTNKLDISDGSPRIGTHATNRPLYVTGNMGANSGIEFRHYNGTQGIGFGYNTIYATGSDADQNLGMQAKGTAGNLLFSTNGNERMRVNGNGNVGIGTTAPNAPLQFASVTTSRKIVLYENGNNDNQFFGFGINASALRYQAQGDHVFYFGVNSTTSNELMRLTSGGNLGIGTASPLQKLHVAGKMAVDNNVGIGITDPHAPLQFNQAEQNRKIVLYENFNNDHEFFGFGINSFALRYQVPGTNFNHIFYAGTSANTSSELMRITGDGKVGIGVTSPNAMLEISRGTVATAPFGSLQVNGTNHNSHFNYGTPEDTYIRGGKPGAKVIINELGGLGNVGIGTANPLQKLHVGGKLAVDNNVGIGNTDPHAPLQFSNDYVNRKIVLFEGFNNDHQYFGLGVNGNTLRYETPSTSDDHVFYAGTSSTTSNELARIKGDGNMTISGIIQSEGWTEPTLINGWTPFSSYPHPYFYKDKIGTVHLIGSLQLNTNPSGVPMFILPAGYRPEVLLAFPANSFFGVDGAIFIGTDGQVWVNAGAPGTPYSLCGITFRAN